MQAFIHSVVQGAAKVTVDLRPDGTARIDVESTVKSEGRITIEVNQVEEVILRGQRTSKPAPRVRPRATDVHI